MSRRVTEASRLVVILVFGLLGVSCVDAEFGGEVGPPRIVYKERPPGWVGVGGGEGLGPAGGGTGSKPPGTGSGGEPDPTMPGPGPENPVGGGGAGGEGEEVPPNHIPEFDPDYEGLDTALTPDIAPPGCVGGYDPETERITLTLGPDVPGVRLHATGKGLFANDVLCTKSGGKPLELNELQRVEVRGGKERNVVILDFSQGTFGESLFKSEGGFHIDVDEGYDHLLVRGSEGDDEYYVGSDTERLMMSLSSLARINVWAKGFDRMTTSLGPGNDLFVPIERLNVGLYDVDTKAPVMTGVLNLPLRVWGGEGDDVLVGSSQHDFLSGGHGDDSLSGLEGSDFFEEGISANGSDVINGGPDLDEVSYRFRTKDLRVQLCHVPDELFGCSASGCDCLDENGESEEGDTVVNLEVARSGAGNDVLLGSRGDDYLYGEAGDDIVTGYAGSDVLQGGNGTDEFNGGDDGDICDNDPGEVVSDCEV